MLAAMSATGEIRGTLFYGTEKPRKARRGGLLHVAAALGHSAK
jgi:hypothetical protein